MFGLRDFWMDRARVSGDTRLRNVRAKKKKRGKRVCLST